MDVAAATNAIRPQKLQSLEQTRAAGGKPTLEQAGKAFEALFVQQMMKSMRDAKLGDGLFDSKAEETFSSMLDRAYADEASKTMRLGIAEAITRQLSPTPPRRP